MFLINTKNYYKKIYKKFQYKNKRIKIKSKERNEICNSRRGKNSRSWNSTKYNRMKILKTNENTETRIKQTIQQSNRNLKSILNILILTGSIGFLSVGLSSYYNKNFLIDSSKIIFFPQGLTMTIYGSIGLILSINQILILLGRIGEGFNEFDKKTRCLKILRKNTYSTNIELIYSFDDIV